MRPKKDNKRNGLESLTFLNHMMNFIWQDAENATRLSRAVAVAAVSAGAVAVPAPEAFTFSISSELSKNGASTFLGSSGLVSSGKAPVSYPICTS